MKLMMMMMIVNDKSDGDDGSYQVVCIAGTNK
jgi:hypothetical protein